MAEEQNQINAPQQEKPLTDVRPIVAGDTPKDEEPVFPLEEFVGDAPQKPQTAPVPSTQPSVAPTAPSTTPQSTQTKVAPPVPQNASEDTKAKKKKLFSFGRKVKMPQKTPVTSAPGNQVGQKAVIKRNSKAGRIILYGLIIVAALVASFFLFFYKITISVNTNPAPDKITIDSVEVTTGAHKFNPGFHEIKVEKEGYISYYASKNFSMGEKLNLNFNLEKSITANLTVEGAKMLSASSSGKYLNFIGEDSRIYTVSLTKDSAKPIELSSEQFSSISKIDFSKNNDFALILDTAAFKIADFTRTDPTSQDQAVALPPSASAISSFSWNNNASSYINEANSKILYDLKTSSTWDLFMMDRASKYSQIVMRIDSSRFQNLNIDWGDSNRTALLTGNEAGLLDLGTREYTALEQNGGYVFGKWGPSGQYAVLTKSDGRAYLLKDNKLQDLAIKTRSFFFKSKNEAYFIEGSKIVLVNFDTGSRINYAEISGLSNADAFVVYQNSVYFADSKGLKSAKLQEGAYGQ